MAWAQLRDEDTGVQFSLPHRVDPQSKQGQSTNVSARVYQEEVDGIEYAVSVIRTNVSVPSNYPKTVYDGMVSALSQGGATDARLTAIKAADVRKGKALDATLTFTATDGTHNYWRMRTITNGPIVVQIQVLTFSEPNDSSARIRVDTMFAQLVDSVTLA